MPGAGRRRRLPPELATGGDRLLIRQVRLDVTVAAVSADPRARRRRTLHPDQRALPLDQLADLDVMYGYSFIVTNRQPGRVAQLSLSAALPVG